MNPLVFLLFIAAALSCQAYEQVSVTGSATGPLAGAQRNVDLTFNSSAGKFLAVWDDKRPSAFGSEDIHGRVINNPADIVICAAAGEQKRPAAAPVQDGFLVFWEDRRNNSAPKGHRDIYAARVSANGVVSPASGLLVSAEADDESDVEAEGNASGVLAVWERSGTVPGIMMMRAGMGGSFLDATPLRLTTGTDLEPDIAPANNGFLVVWERHSFGRRIMAAPVQWSGVGTVLTGPEFEVGPFLDEEAEPEVIWTGSHYLVTWAYRGTDGEAATIVGRRVNADGTAADAVPVTLVSGVRPKDRALLNRSGCIYMLTMPEPAPVKTLQVRQICYGGVIDVTSPENISNPAVDRPEDASVAADAVSGAAWVAWEDSRHLHSPADEDIYLRPFTSLPWPPATLLSSATEAPKVTGAPTLSGNWFAWLHGGGETAAGLVVNNPGTQSAQWFPATLPPVTAPAQSGNRPPAFAMVSTGASSWAVFRRGSNTALEADWFDGFTSGRYVQTGPGIENVLGVGGVSLETDAQGQMIRPALVSVVSEMPGGPVCHVLPAAGATGYLPFSLGPLPASPLDPATSFWGIKIAAFGHRAVIAAWTGHALSNSQYGPDGRLWVRLVQWQNSTLSPLSGWIDAGALLYQHGPEVAAGEAGAFLSVMRSVTTGPAVWNAVRIGWDGTVFPESLAASLNTPGISVVRQGTGFIGFQGVIGGVGGGEMRVTEWDRMMRPVKAWQWLNIRLWGDLSLQSESDSVRLMGDGPAQALWRPFRTGRVFWNVATRNFSLEATGPAGMSVWVRHGPSPAALTEYATAAFEPPGGSFLHPDIGPGTLRYQHPDISPASWFFRLQAHWLYQVVP